MKKLTHEEYEQKLFEIEASLYPVDNYINMRTKIRHECIKGHISLVSPKDLTVNKIGCPICAGRRSQEQYESLLTNLVLLDHYTGSQKPLKHLCTKCFSIWNVRPTDITSGGRTCPNCKNKSCKSLTPGRFYYLKIEDHDLTVFKVGITTNTIKQRFSSDWNQKIFTVLIDEEMPIREAYNKEQTLLKLFKNSRLHLDGFLRSGGNSELFLEDILKITLTPSLKLSIVIHQKQKTTFK